MTIEGYHFTKRVFSRENPPHKPIVFVNKHEPIVFVSKRALSLSRATELGRLDRRGAIKITEITNKNVSYFLKMAIKQNLTNLQEKCLKYLNLQAKKSNYSFYVESRTLYVKIKGILGSNGLNFFKSQLAHLNVMIDLDLNYNHSSIVNEMMDDFGFIEKNNIYSSPLFDFIHLFGERIGKISFEGAVNRYWYIYEFIAGNHSIS